MTQEEKINKLGYDLIEVGDRKYINFFGCKSKGKIINPDTPMFKTKTELLNYLQNNKKENIKNFKDTLCIVELAFFENVKINKNIKVLKNKAFITIKKLDENGYNQLKELGFKEKITKDIQYIFFKKWDEDVFITILIKEFK